MKAKYHTLAKLQKLSTKEGVTVEEYLLSHSEYKLTEREIKNLGQGILKEAKIMIDKLRKESNSD